MKQITENNEHEFRALLESHRLRWRKMGLTPESTGMSEQDYNECVAWSVLEEVRMPRTDENVKRLLSIVGVTREGATQ